MFEIITNFDIECILILSEVIRSVLLNTEYEKYNTMLKHSIESATYDTISYSYTGTVQIPEDFYSILERSKLLLHIPSGDRTGMITLLKENLKVSILDSIYLF